MIEKDFDGKNVINGTHGYTLLDGEYVHEITGGKIGYKTNREDLQFCGDMETDTKLIGITGEFTIKGKKVRSREKSIVEAFASGTDPRSTITMNLTDPDALGNVSVTIFNCWFNDPTALEFESGKTMDFELSGGFKGLKYNDYIV